MLRLLRSFPYLPGFDPGSLLPSNRRASQVANGLIAAGTKPQARIAYLDKNSDRFFEVTFGSAKANAVMVAVNWRLAPPEVAYILNDSNAEVLFTGPDHIGLVKQILPQAKKRGRRHIL